MSPRALRGPGLALGLAVAIHAGTAVCSAQSVRYVGGVSYARGVYVFDQTTHSVWVSNGLTLEMGAFSLSATVPVVIQNSAVVSFVGGQPLPTGGEDADVIRRRREGETVGTHGRRGQGGAGGPPAPAGLVGAGALVDDPSDSATVEFRDRFEAQVGDPLVTGSLRLHSGTGLVRSVALVGSAKAPVRSVESGVGTGAWDVGGGLSVVAGRGRILAFADVSYWSFGDLPDLALDGVWMWAAALSRSLRDGRLAITANATGSTSFVSSIDPPVSAGLGAVLFSPRGRSLSIMGSVGLTEAAADLSVSLSWSLPLR